MQYGMQLKEITEHAEPGSDECIFFKKTLKPLRMRGREGGRGTMTDRGVVLAKVSTRHMG